MRCVFDLRREVNIHTWRATCPGLLEHPAGIKRGPIFGLIPALAADCDTDNLQRHIGGLGRGSNGGSGSGAIGRGRACWFLGGGGCWPG